MGVVLLLVDVETQERVWEGRAVSGGSDVEQAGVCMHILLGKLACAETWRNAIITERVKPSMSIAVPLNHVVLNIKVVEHLLCSIYIAILQLLVDGMRGVGYSRMLLCTFCSPSSHLLLR